jgi:hypothetical protein
MKNKDGHRHEHVQGEDAVLPHHGHINNDYGQRYPPHASSIEDDYDRGVSTQVETHRNYLKSQQEVFGDTIPSIRGDQVQFLNNTLTELVNTTKKMYRLQRAQVPVGRIYMYSFTQSATARLTHLNFVDNSPQNIRLPAGITINIPERKLFTVHIYNDGPGTLAAQINGEISEFEATNIIYPIEDREFTFQWPVIKTLSLVSTSGSCAVRILTMY